MNRDFTVTLENVSVEIQRNLILKDVSTEVPAGTSAALVGVSGCGKTTLLRSIAGLRALSQGRVLIGGHAPHEHYKTRDIAYLFQEPRLWPHLTVQKTLELTFILHLKQPDQERIQEVLHTLGLSEAMHLYPYQLSQGMRARLAIGRSFCVPPGLILADEPFASLDPIRRLQLNRELQEQRRKHACTAVWVTHDIVEALQFSNLVFVLGGKPARIVAVFDMSNYPAITDPAQLPSPCLALREEILSHLHLD